MAGSSTRYSRCKDSIGTAKDLASISSLKRCAAKQNSRGLRLAPISHQPRNLLLCKPAFEVGVFECLD